MNILDVWNQMKQEKGIEILPDIQVTPKPTKLPPDNKKQNTKHRRKNKHNHRKSLKYKLRKNWYKQAGWNGDFDKYGKPKGDRLVFGYNSCKK